MVTSWFFLRLRFLDPFDPFDFFESLFGTDAGSISRRASTMWSGSAGLMSGALKRFALHEGNGGVDLIEQCEVN